MDDLYGNMKNKDLRVRVDLAGIVILTVSIVSKGGAMKYLVGDFIVGTSIVFKTSTIACVTFTQIIVMLSHVDTCISLIYE